MDLSRRHPGTQQLARYFRYDHLTNDDARFLARLCAEFVETVIAALDDGPELTAGLRKALEAKDCFVRASLPADAD